MSLNFIDQLKKTTPKKRARLVMDLQQKNIAFFKKYNPDLGNAIEAIGTGRYEISITPDFLDILDRPTGQYCHPQGALLDYVTKLGAPHHTGWVDKMAVVHRYYGQIEHGLRVAEFVEAMHQSFPVIIQRMQTGIVSLPHMSDGRRFSGVTVFLGIFTGLHILHYLKHTQVSDAVFLEPDLERFALSCFFVDYATIEKIFGRLVLHVGPDMPENPPSLLIDKAQITTTAWLRLLPAYPSKAFDDLIARFELRWLALSEIFVPFDREVRNLSYAAHNLKNCLPLLSREPKLSTNSRIAVVASGPSLEKNVEWLKKHQDRLIIFAAHSAMRMLNKYGVRPDFQCNLDTEVAEGHWAKLELQPDIPLLCYYKASVPLMSYFKEVLLLNEWYKANPVQFLFGLTCTHPTTGNLAVATAAACHPKQLFLIGLDLGFSDPNQDHVRGYWDGFDKKKEQAVPIPAPANFPESEGNIYTYAYYNSARSGVESALQTLATTEIINVSDGVKIAKAQPRHSEELDLPPYPEKEADLVAFRTAFSTEYKSIWKPYHTKGEDILRTMRESAKEVMTLSNFNWPAFTKALDKVWNVMVQRCLDQEAGDLRIEAYSKLIQDLLTDWYRILIFTKTPQETQKAYKKGLEVLIKVLGNLQWDKELDEWEIASKPKESITTEVPISAETHLNLSE